MNMRRQPGTVCTAAATLLLAACAPAKVTVVAHIPKPLLTPLPLKVGVRWSSDFASQVQKEPVGNEEWRIDLGGAQTDAFKRVAAAMFRDAPTVPAAPAAGGGDGDPQHVDATLEASLDSFSTLLPSSGSSYYSATIGYKFELRDADGKELGTWIYEGYGSVPLRGAGQKTAVAQAAGLAIRDAFANMAVHLPEQEIVRRLLPHEELSAP